MSASSRPFTATARATAKRDLLSLGHAAISPSKLKQVTFQYLNHLDSACFGADQSMFYWNRWIMDDKHRHTRLWGAAMSIDAR
jgi:hypothetical protein